MTAEQRRSCDGLDDLSIIEMINLIRRECESLNALLQPAPIKPSDCGGSKP